MGYSLPNFLTLFALICQSICHDPLLQRGNDPCPFHRQPVSYKPLGREFRLGNLSVYETADKKPGRLLIEVHDIFGESSNNRRFADLLAAEYGFRVVVPDFFRGKGLDANNWPPGEKEFGDWLGKVANWDTVVRYDIRNLLRFYNNQGIWRLGIFGFFWGGEIAAKAAGKFPQFRVAGAVHPFSLKEEVVKEVKIPLYLLPCQDDPDLLPHYAILRKKFGDNCGHRRFNDVCHGFATALGNLSDPLISQRVEQTMDILGNFFRRNLPDRPPYMF